VSFALVASLLEEWFDVVPSWCATWMVQHGVYHVLCNFWNFHIDVLQGFIIDVVHALERRQAVSLVQRRQPNWSLRRLWVVL